MITQLGPVMMFLIVSTPKNKSLLTQKLLNLSFRCNPPLIFNVDCLIMLISNPNSNLSIVFNLELIQIIQFGIKSDESSLRSRQLKVTISYNAT